MQDTRLIAYSTGLSTLSWPSSRVLSMLPTGSVSDSYEAFGILNPEEILIWSPAFYYIFKFVLVLWMSLPQFKYVFSVLVSLSLSLPISDLINHRTAALKSSSTLSSSLCSPVSSPAARLLQTWRPRPRLLPSRSEEMQAIDNREKIQTSDSQGLSLATLISLAPLQWILSVFERASATTGDDGLSGWRL